MSRDRFTDPGVRLWAFADDILVRCPRCGGRAVVSPYPEHRESHPSPAVRLTAPHRLVCPACAHTAEWTARHERGYARPPRLTGPNGPFFDLPLWLSRPCCGHVLWAYNEPHLTLIESYVSAHLRERGGWTGSGSMLEHLPAWIKAASNRPELLKTIQALRSTL
ncbi:hypothetical protein [Actinomadura sp. 21ATH]|uniref:hypothetical protein n=1 Tax=Actinomadura sp. 21ATH TaxID=1735444 RepID=UPI0035BF9421